MWVHSDVMNRHTYFYLLLIVFCLVHNDVIRLDFLIAVLVDAELLAQLLLGMANIYHPRQRQYPPLPESYTT